MTHLYSCKSEIDATGATAYRITKFDSDLTVLASYRLLGNACDCPAGVRPSCRHRDMLPRFLARGAVNTFWFYDFDRNGWVSMGNAEEALEQSVAEGEAKNITATEINQRIKDYDGPLPDDGIIMMALDNIAEVHNTIAEAVGEPKLPPRINRRGF